MCWFTVARTGSGNPHRFSTASECPLLLATPTRPPPLYFSYSFFLFRKHTSTGRELPMGRRHRRRTNDFRQPGNREKHPPSCGPLWRGSRRGAAAMQPSLRTTSVASLSSAARRSRFRWAKQFGRGGSPLRSSACRWVRSRARSSGPAERSLHKSAPLQKLRKARAKASANKDDKDNLYKRNSFMTIMLGLQQAFNAGWSAGSACPVRCWSSGST